jgi:hypothetical protein
MPFRFSLPVVIFLMAVVGAHADEPPMDVHVLADGDGNSVWHTAEATMLPDATHAIKGRSMRFHIDVNHETGQPDYPIGWPRTYITVPAEARDWQKWDFVEFRLYADSSREKLPNTPLGFIVRSPNKANSYQRSVDEVRKDQWVHVRIPTSEMPNPAECTAIQFYVSESNYQHGDVLDFWIDGLALLRYAEPTILSMHSLGEIQYADARVVRVRVRMTGLDERQTAELSLRLTCQGKTVCRSSTVVRSGSQTIPLVISEQLDVGRYELQAQIADSKRVVTNTLRVISSPWEEKVP